MKKPKAANTVYNKKLQGQRHVAAAAKREECKKEKVEKAAKKAAKKVAQNTQKAISPLQKSKRKTSSAFSSNPKQQKRSGGAAAPVEVESAVPAQLNRHGCAVELPGRYTQSN
jgi:hypothetical protein